MKEQKWRHWGKAKENKQKNTDTTENVFKSSRKCKITEVLLTFMHIYIIVLKQSVYNIHKSF